MDSDTRPGRRGRHPRCSRESSRSAGGLRLFSLKVVEKIRSRGRTTYTAVANELVSDQNMSGGSARDGKSIRRRCYDAINVLLACGLIKKDDKKQIVWRGHGSVEVDRLRAEVEKKAEEMEQKKKLLQDMERKHKTLEALLALGANRAANSQDSGCGSGGSSSACSRNSQQGGQRYTIPFMLVQAPAGSAVKLHTSEDKTTVQFELTDAPPELHDDCSVVMRLQQHEAELQANRKPRGPSGPSRGTDSGVPTPAQQQAAEPSACELPTPEAQNKQLPLPQQERQQQQECRPAQPGAQQPPPPLQQQQQHPSQAQQLAVRDLQTQEQLPPAPPSPPRQRRPAHHYHHPHPHHLSGHAAAGGLPCLPLPGQGAGSSEPRPEVDFLAHLKPVVTNRSRLWPRLLPPVLPPLGSQAQLQAAAAEPPAAAQPRAAAAAGPSWELAAAAVAQPAPQALPGLPPPQALSPLPPQRQCSQPDLGFSPTFCHLFCARSLEQQLQPPSASCQPFSARDCFHAHLAERGSGSDPLQAHLPGSGSGDGCGSGSDPMDVTERQHGFGPLGQDADHQHHHQHHQHPQPLQQHLDPQQPQGQVQEHQKPPAALEQVPPAGAGASALLAPSAPSLYTLEEMGEEHLPSNLLLFGAGDGGSDPDPFGFGIGSSSLAADQLGYMMGWPLSISPVPFSPSSFLVSPVTGTCGKGQCRSESNRQVGPLHIGVQQ